MIVRKLQVCSALLAVASLTVSTLYAQAPAAQQPAAPATPQAAQTPNPPAPAATPQQPPQPLNISLAPDYSKGAPWFPDIIAPYVPRHIPQPVLTNSPRLAQLVNAGKLNLSLEDAVALAIENNLDIAVNRYTPWLAEMNLLLARSGANGRVQFDPTLTGNLNFVDATQPIANPLLSGVGVSNVTSSLTQHTVTGNFGYTQGFITGTQVQMSFNNQRSSSSTSANVFNPALSSTLAFTVTQPLLNGFGILPNTRYIVEAKNTVKSDEWLFKQQVIADVTKTANDYWNLVYARAFVDVENATVAVDQQLYDDNQKQLTIGTMAPLDVLTAESQLASDKTQLVNAQGQEQTDETNLLIDITKDPLDPVLNNVEVVPTTPISTADNVGNPTTSDAVALAWRDRPELQELQYTLKNADVEVKVTTNEMRPTLNLVGQYSTTGLGGVSKATATTPTGATAAELAAPIVDTTGAPVLDPITGLPEYVGVATTTSTNTLVPGGISDAWDSLIHSRFPTFQVGVNFNLPIRNRAQQSSTGQALLNQRMDVVQYQEEKNTIFQAVRNALIAVVQERVAVQSAATARQLSQQTYDDEVKKYQLGSSTSYNVVLMSRDLQQAKTTELNAQIGLIESVVTYDQAVGRTLEQHSISITDARDAKIATVPNIPGTPVH